MSKLRSAVVRGPGDPGSDVDVRAAAGGVYMSAAPSDEDSTSGSASAGTFVLAAAASAATFGGNALLARHQYVVAEHASATTPVQQEIPAPRARRA